ncbi:MAG: hypothetical protein ACRDKV_11245 [Solirubrobacterales bacterium]
MRPSACLAVLLALAAMAACGSADDDTTPVACLNGEPPYARALESAPGAVRLEGETPISDCLVENQSAGDLGQLGTILVGMTTDLNTGARADPGGAPTVQLGYLIGAVERGAERTGGIHAELVRRLEAAALFSPAGKPPPPPFDQTYAKGYAAGMDDG